MKTLPNAMPLQRRAAQVDAVGKDGERLSGADPGRFSFALSSETPVRQWFGNEVLKHGKDNIRTGRLNSGLPLHFNHDTDKHIGTADSYEIKDGVLRVSGPFSRSPLAQEKRQDYDDGILKDASVGYRVHKMVRTEDEDNPNAPDNVDVTDWEPYEASLVTVPADPSVGVGRAAAGTEEFPLTVEVVAKRSANAGSPAISPQEKKPMEPTVESVRESQAAETARRDRILAIASDKDFSKHVTTEDARKAIADNMSADAFGEMVARKIIAANDISKIGTAGDHVFNQASEKEKRSYSVVRFIASLAHEAMPSKFKKVEAGFEREMSEAISKYLRVPTEGAMIPLNALLGRALGTQTIASGSGQLGLTSEAAAVETITRPEVIELLRNRPRAVALGARMLGGLQGVVRLPRQNAAGVSYWLGEGAAVTESDLGMDYVSVSPKRLSQQTAWTVELLAEASPDVEGLARADMNKVRILALDLATITGAGSGGVPQGILTASGLATLNPSGTAFADGGQPLTYADVLKFESTVAAANADSATSGWMFTPEVRAQLKGTAKFPAGLAMPIWDDYVKDPDGTEQGPLGYKAGVTNQLPKNGTKSGVTGSILHAAIFGDFSQLLLADWGAVEVIVDPYTQAANGAIVVTQRSLHDIAIRHIAAFCASTTIAIS